VFTYQKVELILSSLGKLKPPFLIISSQHIKVGVRKNRHIFVYFVFLWFDNKWILCQSSFSNWKCPLLKTTPFLRDCCIMTIVLTIYVISRYIHKSIHFFFMYTVFHQLLFFLTPPIKLLSLFVFVLPLWRLFVYIRIWLVISLL